MKMIIKTTSIVISVLFLTTLGLNTYELFTTRLPGSGIFEETFGEKLYLFCGYLIWWMFLQGVMILITSISLSHFDKTGE